MTFEAFLKLMPPHEFLKISHNAHKVFYETISNYIHENHDNMGDEDAAACMAADEIWEVNFSLTNVVSFYDVGAATLECALDLAADLLPPDQRRS